MTADPCRAWREEIGALVLGRLTGADAAGLRAHLEGCRDCRLEVEALQPLAELLPLADVERLGARPAPPSGLGGRVTRRLAAEARLARRRSRRRLGFRLATATASLAVLAAAALLVIGNDGGSASAQRLAFRSLPAGVQMRGTLASHEFGSEVRLHVEGISPGTRCTVFVRKADGSHVAAGSFRYFENGGSNAAVLTAAVSPSDARAVDVRAGGRTYEAPLE
ncbi:MAG: hypothetical protein QOG09_1594 [Solirubrobacterales bacterium]|jgi:anti-sigma factor RsiW|nr:hypothetical protein [Solirubrobacterales bacterium]MDX6663492.1 hypothetical protein [Solirubrobacterales bacterium]